MTESVDPAFLNFKTLQPADFANLLPCEHCIADPCRMAQSDGYVACYCAHRSAGMHYCNGIFTALCPVTSVAFAAVLIALETRLAQRDAQRQATN